MTDTKIWKIAVLLDLLLTMDYTVCSKISIILNIFIIFALTLSSQTKLPLSYGYHLAGDYKFYPIYYSPHGKRKNERKKENAGNNKGGAERYKEICEILSKDVFKSDLVCPQ